MKKLSILASILALLINFSAVATEHAPATGTCTKDGATISASDKSDCETQHSGVWKDAATEAPKN